MIYAFGAMLSFTMAHAAVATLQGQTTGRRAARGSRRSASTSAAGSCPLTAVFGGLGTGIALVVATVLDIRVLISGVGMDGASA